MCNFQSESRQVGDDQVGRKAKTFHRRIGTIDPGNAIAERPSTSRVPTIAGHEEYLVRWAAQRIESKLVDSRVRLIAAGGVDTHYRLKVLAQTGGRHGRLQHRRAAVGQDDARSPVACQTLERCADFGIGAQLQPTVQCAASVGTSKYQPKMLGGNIERISRHLPEIDIRGWAHECPQEAVLQLLGPPQRNQPCGVRGQPAQASATEATSKSVP